MKNIPIVVAALGLIATIVGAILLGIRLANLDSGYVKVKKGYLFFPSLILVIGFLIFAVMLYYSIC